MKQCKGKEKVGWYKYVPVVNFPCEVVDSGSAGFVDCFAPWCEPRRVIGTLLEEIAQDNDLNTILKVIGGDNPQRPHDSTEDRPPISRVRNVCG